MTITSAIITLFLVMNSLGNIPIFIALLNTVEESRRAKIIIREAFFAYCILVLFLFVGESLLQGLNITQPALSMAGGIILFLIAIQMIFPPEHDPVRDKQLGEPFIVPMAIPLLAGASSIATVLLLASTDPERTFDWFIAIGASSLATTLVLLTAPFLKNKLGQKGLVALERLMGMILTTMSVQMFLTGIEEYFSIGKISGAV